MKKDSQPESTSTGKTHAVVVVAIVCCCICKYAIQSDYVTNKCPNECRRRVRNAASGAACASRLINRANSGTNLKPVYKQCCRAAVAAASRHQLQSQSMLIVNKIINEIVYSLLNLVKSSLIYHDICIQKTIPSYRTVERCCNLIVKGVCKQETEPAFHIARQMQFLHRPTRQIHTHTHRYT